MMPDIPCKRFLVSCVFKNVTLDKLMIKCNYDVIAVDYGKAC